ncbi:MAG: hypothetical protein Q8P18_24000 [Pseudomonadota bacterium]|nr:hypothetical protein [Pseudomonadota bacterium]
MFACCRGFVRFGPLVALALAVAAPPASAAPGLRVRIFVLEPGRLDLRVSGPDGAIAWSCRVRGPWSEWDEEEFESRCPPDGHWYAGPGLYTVEARLQRGLRRTERARTVLVGGEERSVGVEVKVARPAEPTPNNPRGRPERLSVETSRTLPPSPELVLVRAWEPAPMDPPRYRIANHTADTLYGRNGTLPLRGWMERLEGGRWERYSRGGFCWTGMRFGGIAPGADGGSNEGSFMGSVRELFPGRYRYVVPVTATDPRAAPGAEPAVWWELTDEFEIERMPRTWTISPAPMEPPELPPGDAPTPVPP